MNTSYFYKYNKFKLNNGVSIAIKSPDYFGGKIYKDLYPKWYFLKQYFIDKDELKYTEYYYNDVLLKLNPVKVYEDLTDSVLLCWEKSSDFCHRFLVAKWIEDSIGVKVIEL